MVVTNNAEIAERVRMLRDHGRQSKYEHEIIGFGERLDALQAAILRVKLQYLDTWNAQRRRAAAAYRAQLGSSALLLPYEVPGVDHVYHLFVIRVPDRDRILHRLQAAGVRAGVHYPIPLHLQPAYATLGYHMGDFPHAEQASQQVLSLPLYPEISDAQIGEVAAALIDTVEAPDRAFAGAPGLREPNLTTHG
jgi:dTDP-4-amino-4,6-dideoxygalactose transaminase